MESLDILLIKVPYDATRVLLKEAPSGDYINASHIKVIAID